jgi:hypothetical protein
MAGRWRLRGALSAGCGMMVLLLLALSAAGTSAEEAPARPSPDLTAVTDATTLEALLVDTTLYGILNYSGVERWSEYYCANGRALYVRGTEAIRGRWWVEAPLMCFQYDAPENNGAYCFETYLHTNGTYHLRDSAVPEAGIVVIVEGRIRGDVFGMQKTLGMTCEDLSS